MVPLQAEGDLKWYSWEEAFNTDMVPLQGLGA